MHLLGLFRPALIIIQIAEIVDYVERRGVIWSPSFLPACQCSLVHLLSLLHPAWITTRLL